MIICMYVFARTCNKSLPLISNISKKKRKKKKKPCLYQRKRRKNGIINVHISKSATEVVMKSLPCQINLPGIFPTELRVG